MFSKLLLKFSGDDTGLDNCDLVPSVDFKNPVQAGCGKYQSACRGECSSCCSAARTPGYNRKFMLVCKFQECCNLFGGVGYGNGFREKCLFAAVIRVAMQLLRALAAIFSADNGADFLKNYIFHLATIHDGFVKTLHLLRCCKFHIISTDLSTPK